MERRHTVYQMYAESNVTSCVCHKLGICTLTNPSVDDVIYFFAYRQLLFTTIINLLRGEDWLPFTLNLST